jgi:hypothetical protein
MVKLLSYVMATYFVVAIHAQNFLRQMKYLTESWVDVGPLEAHSWLDMLDLPKDALKTFEEIVLENGY